MNHISRSNLPPILLGLAMIAAATGCATSSKSSVQGAENGAAEARPTDGQPLGRAMRLFEDALAAFEEQKSLKVYDWGLLEKKFQAALAADDQFAEAHYNLGVVYERMRRPEDAKRAYQRALQIKPYLKEAAENLAILLQAEGRTADALALIQEILRMYPEDGSARARLASLYQAVGDHKQAMHYAREALMRDPKNLTAYKVMMNCYLDRENLDMARLVAMRATKLNASDPELYYTMGLIQERQDDQAGAIYQYLRALELRDDFLRARVRIAQIATKHSDWSTAATHYQKIVQYDSSNQEARLNLGIAYKGLGEIDKAMAEYDAILQTPTPIALAYFAMGVLFQAHKDLPDKALEYYKQFVAKSPSTVPANHAVFERIRECEQAIREAAELKAAEERAAREAEIQRQREEEQRRIEEANKLAAEKAQEEAEKAERQKAAQELLDGKPAEDGAAAPAESTEEGAATPEGESQGGGEASAEGDASGQETAAAEAAPDEPADEPVEADEPSDEPADL